MIKTLLNGKKVPSPIYDNNRYHRFERQMSTFQLLLFRTMQLWKNISALPNTCFKQTNNILDTIIFSKEHIYIYIYIIYIYIYIYIYYIYIYIYIYQMIKNLDPNKAHGHDMISIRMIKLCGISICKPLNKFSNVISTFKKDDKQCIKIIVHLMTVMK